MATTKATTAELTQKLAATTNAEFWDMARNTNPTFKAHTSKASDIRFTEEGYEAIMEYDPNILNDWLNITLKAVLTIVDTPKINNFFDSYDFVEYYTNEYGAYTQRLAVTDTLKPIDPKFRNLKDGSSVDMYTVRKQKIEERFFKKNSDFQDLRTISRVESKLSFINENGLGAILAGVVEGLTRNYDLSRYLRLKETINASLHSKKWQLKPTQKISTKFTNFNAPTEEELKNFILTLKDLVTYMKASPLNSKGFNEAGYSTAVMPDEYTLLLRGGIKNRLDVLLNYGAHNQPDLALPFKTVEVLDFGGLEPYKEAGFTTPLYPVYDKLGAVIGYNTTPDQTVATVTEDKVYWKDPNDKIMGLLVQKGRYFVINGSSFEIEPVRNVAGKYVNYWASKEGDTYAFDSYRNMIMLVNE